jgi:hypothetical protein
LRTFGVGVRTRGSGALDREAPTVAQFDHMIAAVALPQGALLDRWPVVEVEGLGRLLFLDGTARDWSPWTLPAGDQGTFALLLLPDGGKVVELPVQPPEASTVERTLEAAVDETGSLRTATVEERFHDARASMLRSEWAGVADAERRRLQEEWLQSRFPGSRLGAYSVEGLDRTEVPVVERSALEGGWFGKRVAGMLIVSPGRAARGLFSRPLPAKAPWGMRTVPQVEKVDANILVPEGYEPESLPGVVELRAAGVDGRAEWTFEQGRLRYRRVARLTAKRVSPEDYPAFREAVRRLDAADATAVVFVKSAP